jgi:hypothetical protein
MKSFLATLFLSLASATANAATITYFVDRVIGDGTVTGTITTDGTLGTLHAGNIDSWTLTLTAQNLSGGLPDTTTDVISSADTSSRTVIRPNTGGTAVSATPTQLLFDFDFSVDSYFFLRGGSGNYWCLETSVCIDDGVDKAETMGINIDGSTVAQRAEYAGVVAFATVVPVPAAIWLFGSGLLGLIGLARTRRR